MSRTLFSLFVLLSACTALPAPSPEPKIAFEPAPTVVERIAIPSMVHGPLVTESPTCAEIHVYVRSHCAQGTLDACLASAPGGDWRPRAAECCETSSTPLAYCDPCERSMHVSADREIDAACCLRDPSLPMCASDEVVVDAAARCDFVADFVVSRCEGEPEDGTFSIDCVDRAAADRAFVAFVGTDLHTAAEACCELGDRLAEAYPFCPYERGDAVTRRLPEELAPLADYALARYVEITAHTTGRGAARLAAIHVVDEVDPVALHESRLAMVRAMSRGEAIESLHGLGEEATLLLESYYYEDVATRFFEVVLAPDAQTFVVAVEPDNRALVVERPRD